MLRTRLFLSFAAIILLFGVLSAWFGIKVINERVVAEAQNRVEHDLKSAWAEYKAQAHELQTVLDLESRREDLISALQQPGRRQPLAARLEGLRKSFGMDFISLSGADGNVALRTAPSYQFGDTIKHHTFFQQAMMGETVSGTVLLSGMELERESEGLAEKAFLMLEDTPKARRTPKTDERRGMIMLIAVPVVQGPQVLGVLYGGVLLNRNAALVDHIREVNYGSGEAGGTVTIFLHDSRIATTVRKANGNRAIGTRVSQEVADQVLDNARSWKDRAYVVKDWYITAYDPIYNLDREVIGMLYVGILEAPFAALQREIIWRFTGLAGLVGIFSLVVGYFVAGRLAQPIHQLVMAARRVHQGAYPSPVPADRGSMETKRLTEAFNEMVAALKEREENLNQANDSLQATNRNYMETLGFVTHEMNNPISSMMNYTFLLKGEMIGPLTAKQKKAVGVIDHSTRRLTEMVRHYLNLSRIEKNELKCVPTRIDVQQDVVQHLADAFAPHLAERRQQWSAEMEPGLALKADLNLVREVFDNLVSNAIKYGRQDGQVKLSAQVRKAWVEFEVWNEGAGIAAEEQKALFKKFSRLEGAGMALREKGTGLGLFITRHIIEAHGGTIQVLSEPNQWTAFKFTLPLWQAERQSQQAQGEPR